MAVKKPPHKVEGTERVWGLKEIEKLIDVLIDRQVTEFEMEQAGARIRVKRGDNRISSPAGPEACLSVPVIPQPSPVAPSVSEAVAAPPPASEPSAREAAAEPAEGLHLMKSPIVGTFYSSSSPDSPPFAKVGDVVRVGQVLCIIEAMKLMNELESEVEGEVVRVYVENGQPVEYGQSLFAIRPSPGK